MCSYHKRGKYEMPRTCGKRMTPPRRRRANNRRVIGAAFLVVVMCATLSFVVKNCLATNDIEYTPADKTTSVIVIGVDDVRQNTADAIHTMYIASEAPATNPLVQEFADTVTDAESITVEDNEENVPVEEIKEEIVETEPEEPKRENTLYYVQDGRYRYDLPDEYQDYLWQQCKAYGISEYYELLLAQMYHESSFRVDIVSSTNDYGLMQINICNHKWLSGIIGDDNFLNPYTSIRAGVHMMSTFLHKYNDVQKALVCYNMGEGKVINGTYTSSYSRGVLEDVDLLVAK